jgi:hypothetical protein
MGLDRLEVAVRHMGGSGKPALGPGLLSGVGGGLAFSSPDGSAVAIAATDLRRLGPPSGEPPNVAGLDHVLVADGVAGGRAARHAFRLDAVDGHDLVLALARERRCAGLPDIPIVTGAGFAVVAPDADDEEAVLPGLEPPSPSENVALPVSSLPHLWLRATAEAHRPSCRHVDGASMLLELAIRGLAESPARRELTIADGAQNDALRGALSRVAARMPIEPRPAASLLGAYVSGLDVRTTGADAARERLLHAIVGREPTDLRTALVVWLLKQDYVLGQTAARAVIPGPGREVRRALQGASPDLYARADPTVAARAHRMLYALILQPLPLMPGA